MSVQFEIPRVLEKYSGGITEFKFEADSVNDLLMIVKKQIPEVYECVCDETDNLRRHINLFINDDLMFFPAALNTPIKAGDVVSVFQAVSGG